MTRPVPGRSPRCRRRAGSRRRRAGAAARRAPGEAGAQQRAGDRSCSSEREQAPVDPARQVAGHARHADGDSDREVRADRLRRRLAEAQERGHPERAQYQPDQAAEQPDQAARDHRCAQVDAVAWLRGCSSRTQEVEPEREQDDADHDEQRTFRQRPGDESADHRANHGRRRHPHDEPPVDASGADMRRPGRERRNRRDADVRSRAGRRVRRAEQQRR